MSRKSPKNAARRARQDETVALETVAFEAAAGAADFVLVEQLETIEAALAIEAPAESEYGPEVLPTDDPRWKSSVVPAKYRRRYAAHNESCGDNLATDSKAFLTIDTEDGPKLNLGLLVRWAEANGCWVETYSKLNPGMQRMNVVNRLRAKVRKGHQVDCNVA